MHIGLCYLPEHSGISAPFLSLRTLSSRHATPNITLAAVSDSFIVLAIPQSTFQEVNLDTISHASRLLPPLNTPNVTTDSAVRPLRPLRAAPDADAMAASPPLSIPPSPVDLPNAEDESLLRIQVSDPRLPLGNIFVRVYEHLDYLREMGHHEAADKMDKSRSVSRLIEIASGDGWQSFDTIWSAKEFREILYHAIAPQKGGPLWFRESARKLILEDICMTQMPHVRSSSGSESWFGNRVALIT